MRRWLVLGIILLLQNTSLAAWKEKKDHYEFRFDWDNEGVGYWVTFRIPKEQVLKSYNEIKTYDGSWKKGYEKVKDQYTKRQNQPNKNVNMVRLNWEKFIDQDSPHLKELAQGLIDTSPDKSKRGLAEHTLAFVQSIPYSDKFDNKSGYITPIRVLLENKGDCDSKSALMAAIVTQMEIDWKLLYYPTHVLIGVQVPRFQGDSFLPSDQDYILAETTYEGWKLGDWDNSRDRLIEVVDKKLPLNPTPTKTNELSEKEQITKLIEDSKLFISKRNTAVVGSKTTIRGLQSINPQDLAKIRQMLSSGEVLDLGTYPNPYRQSPPTVVWKEEPKEETNQLSDLTLTTTPSQSIKN